MIDLLREWNDLESARNQIRHVLENMKSWRNQTDLVIEYLVQARVQQAINDLEGASATIEKAEKYSIG